MDGVLDSPSNYLHPEKLLTYTTQTGGVHSPPKHPLSKEKEGKKIFLQRFYPRYSCVPVEGLPFAI